MPNAKLYAQRIGNAPRNRFWRQEGWSKGANSFAEDNEVRDVEFYKARNVEITGRSSIRMGRRGHRVMADIVGGTDFNGWGIYKNPKTDANLMIVQHTGRLYRINTADVVTEIDNAETWDAEAKMRGILLREWFYFGNGIDAMAKTDGSSIERWTEITAVAGLGAVVTSTADDDTLYEYAVTATTPNGETEYEIVTDDFAPKKLGEDDYLTLTWTRKTDTDVTGYNIYKAVNGRTLQLLTFVDQPTSGTNVTYADKGIEQQSLIHEAPTFNTTGGVKGNIFDKYANTLFVSGNPDEPDTVFYGGTGSQWESFSPDANGGAIRVGRGDGERVTALIGFDDFLLIFKETSIWKFVFGGDGSPTLVSVIPQYGTKSPDTCWRMEKDVVYFGHDGRYRILGYEPNQLNVIRTADISNRIQPELDVLDKSNLDNFFGVFFEQKYMVCNGSKAFPYDRRYTGFLGEWTNMNFSRFIIWDKGSGKERLFGARKTGGGIDELLVEGTWDDNGDTVDCFIRFKRIDGELDSLKYFHYTKFKLKFPRGQVTFLTYRDGANLLDTTSLSFSVGGGIGEFMFDEAMFDEGLDIEEVEDAVQYVTKDLEVEAYSYYHQLVVQANEYNHCLVQTMAGRYEEEDDDYRRDERVI
jgi:hypothetical protein